MNQINYEPRVSDHNDDGAMDTCFADYILTTVCELDMATRECLRRSELIALGNRLNKNLRPVVKALQRFRGDRSMLSTTPPLVASHSEQESHPSILEHLQYLEDHTLRFSRQVRDLGLRENLKAFATVLANEKKFAASYFNRSSDGYWG